MARGGQRFRDSVTAFASVGRNPNLRWLELSWAASIIGHYAFLIAVSVYAYGIGGTRAVGLLVLARLIPAAFAAPFAGMLGDRYPRQRVLLFTNVARIVLVGAAAIAVLADMSPWLVYALSITATIAYTPFRPSQAALTPTLAQAPEELTAANAVASGIESVAFFAGPALAGALLATASAGSVFLITAALIVVSAVFILLMRIDTSEQPHRELAASTIAAERLAGFTTLTHHPSLRVMAGLLTAQTTMFGALQVFLVVMALDLLDLGDGGVGYLGAAMGIGAFLGALGALSLTGVRRLSPAFLIGLAVSAIPLAAIGLWSTTAAALLALGVLGVGNSFADVAGLTLLQRAVPDDVLARVFGVLQMLFLASQGIGAALAPVLIAWLGIDGALIFTGVVIPVLVVVSARTVARIDAHAEVPDADELRILVPLRVEPGTVVIREGDEGDRFYLVAEGTLDVSQDDAKLTELHAGDYFGEIALLRDTTRTATVTARTDAVLYGLDREEFLAAVTGHPQSAEAAESVMSARLAGPAATGYRSAAN